MSSEATKTNKKKRNWTLLVAVLSLTVSILVPTYPTISSAISQAMFPRADYSIDSYSKPSTFPQPFDEMLVVSERYYVVTTINLRSETPFIGEPLRFSVFLENKGKTVVQQPRITIYLSDFMHRVWGSWNESVTKEKFGQEMSFEYHFPAPDKKILGTWVIFALVYDDAKGELVSYEIIQFSSSDVNIFAISTVFLPTIIFTSMAVAVVFLITKRRANKRRIDDAGIHPLREQK